MNYACCFYLCLYSSILIAPDFDSFETETSTRSRRSREQKEEKKQREVIQVRHQEGERLNTKNNERITPEALPHENQESGRTPFEDELKTAFDARRKNPNLSREKSLRQAKALWEKSQSSHIPARDFVMHLKNRYEGSMHNVYSVEKISLARSEFAADLEEISPFLYKTWRDSFFVARGKEKGEVRTDESFFAWLNENPNYLTSNPKEHEKTPLEIACDGNSPEMARKVLKIAQTHNVNVNTLIEPLVEKYKIIYQSDGETAAYDYLQTIYDMNISRLSNAMFEKLKNIPFPSNA